MGSLNTPSGYATGSATVSTAAKPISDAVFGFTAAQLNTADGAIVSATSDMLFTIDGATTPVIATLLGHVLPANTIMTVDGGERVRKLNFIRKSADGVVTITLEKF